MYNPSTCEPVAASVKHFTAQAHMQLEEWILPKLTSIQTPDDYQQLLKSFYGYFKPVETLIEKHIDGTILEDIHQRRKADSIINDLQDSDNIPTCTDLPAIDNTAKAIGAMYVLEGSTLGGRGITKMLLKNCSFIEATHLHFFNGYGEATGKMWTSFQTFLNEYDYDDKGLEEMLRSANDTFICFKNWISKTLY